MIGKYLLFNSIKLLINNKHACIITASSLKERDMKAQRMLRVVARLTRVSLWLAIVGAVVLVAAMIVVTVAPSDATTTSVEWRSQGLAVRFDQLQAGPRRLDLIGFLGAGVVLVGFGIFVLRQLEALLAGFERSEFFSEATTARIRRIGFAMIAAGVLSGLIRTIVAWHIAATVDIAGVSLSVVPGPDWGVVAVGLIVAVLGEAFRHGAELQRDHDLTV
jgi:hypothetical protein